MKPVSMHGNRSVAFGFSFEFRKGGHGWVNDSLIEAPESGAERHVLGRLLPPLSPQKGASLDFAMIPEEIPLIRPW
jgi:hypothetical protein